MEATLFASCSMHFVKAAVALPQPRDISTTPKILVNFPDANSLENFSVLVIYVRCRGD